MRYDPEPANCDMIKGQHRRSSNKYRPPSHITLSIDHIIPLSLRIDVAMAILTMINY